MTEVCIRDQHGQDPEDTHMHSAGVTVAFDEVTPATYGQSYGKPAKDANTGVNAAEVPPLGLKGLEEGVGPRTWRALQLQLWERAAHKCCCLRQENLAAGWPMQGESGGGAANTPTSLSFGPISWQRTALGQPSWKPEDEEAHRCRPSQSQSRKRRRVVLEVSSTVPCSASPDPP